MNPGGNLSFTSSRFLNILIYIGCIALVAGAIAVALHASNNSVSEKDKVNAVCYSGEIPSKAAHIPNLKDIGDDAIAGPIAISNKTTKEDKLVYSKKEYLDYLQKNCEDRVNWQVPVRNKDTYENFAGVSIATYAIKDSKKKQPKDKCKSGYVCQGPWSLKQYGLLTIDLTYKTDTDDVRLQFHFKDPNNCTKDGACALIGVPNPVGLCKEAIRQAADMEINKKPLSKKDKKDLRDPNICHSLYGQENLTKI